MEGLEAEAAVVGAVVVDVAATAAARTAGEGGAYSSRTPNPIGRWLELKMDASYASNKDGFKGGASSFAGRYGTREGLEEKSTEQENQFLV